MVPNEDGKEEKIEMCRPDKGNQIMGVIAAAGGNMDGQLKRFQDKLDIWLSRIDDGHLPCKAVWTWTAFFGTIWSTIVYALPDTTITLKKFGKLMRPVFVRLLSRIGVNRNMHCNWVFAHKDFSGAWNAELLPRTNYYTYEFP